MSNFAIITTSINERPEAYARWAKIGKLYVAGDMNSPAALQAYIESLDGVYLTPQAQSSYNCSDLIGWRNIQRRNIALLRAFEDGHYDYYVTVDDDNTPPNANTFKYIVDDRFGKLTSTTTKVVTDETWWNPGRLGHPSYRQRGLPANYNDLTAKHRTERQSNIDIAVGVLQCMITGDPDCDAVQRIVRPVDVRYYEQDAFPEFGVYAPFNSQATVWPMANAPLMAVLPYCQRFDDIYASVIATRILHHMGQVVMFGGPIVHQDRNPHDLGKDLLAEAQGMNDIQHMVDVLNGTKLDETDDIMDHYDKCINALLDNGCIIMRTAQFAQAYMADLSDTNWR